MNEGAAPPVAAAPKRPFVKRLFASWRGVGGPVLWLAKWLLRATWFLVIPALLAALVLRYLVPRPWDPAATGSFLGAVARLGSEHPIELAVGLFLGFASLVHYWSARLPGGRFLAAETPPQSTWRSSLKFAGLVALAATLALVARSSGFQPYRVLGGSMLPALRPGDYVGVNRAAFGFRLPGFRREARMPARGDLVVFRNPVRDSGPPELLKRVIGLPGDQIRTFGAQVFVNEWRVPTCFAGTYVYLGSEGRVAGRIFVEFLADRAYLTLVEPVEGTPFGPYLVKPGEAFVLGDHRSTSTDSRAWTDRFGRPGRGIAMRVIYGRADWLLARTQRDGSHDFSGGFAPLGIVPEADGIDISRLRAGIEQCLAKRPAETHPPAQAAAASLSHSGASE